MIEFEAWWILVYLVGLGAPLAMIYGFAWMTQTAPSIHLDLFRGDGDRR